MYTLLTKEDWMMYNKNDWPCPETRIWASVNYHRREDRGQKRLRVTKKILLQKVDIQCRSKKPQKIEEASWRQRKVEELWKTAKPTSRLKIKK